MTTTEKGDVTPQLVIGLAVMLMGILLTLDVLGMVRAGDILRFWPAVLVVIGALTLTRSSDASTMVVGALQMLFGTWLLLTILHVLPSRSWRLFWPFLLIAGGGALVVHTMRRVSDRQRTDPRETVNMIGVMGGGNKTSNANPFKGGELVAFMGGGRLDLRHAVIRPGEQATIDIFSMMGGYEIIVPEAWVVDDRTVAFMGGVGNETRSPPAGGSPPLLVMRGFLMMGGVNIKN